MLKLSYLVDNPWGNALTKAEKAGRVDKFFDPCKKTLMSYRNENRFWQTLSEVKSKAIGLSHL